MNRVYLDHAATSPLSLAALDAMRPYLVESFGNPSSIHVEGQRARAAVDDARSLVADALGVRDEEIVFTSSGTEADNLALRGACWAHDERRPRLITTATEHDAVRRTARWLDSHGDAESVVIPVNADGRVDAREVIAQLTPATALVSVMLVNNETGVLHPVREIGAACRDAGIPFHVDAVQALGRVELRPADVPADLVTLSAHKVGGPKGCGVLVVRRGLKIQPALTGGAQELGLRPGTEPVASIVGGARAIADAAASWSERRDRLSELTARLERGLTAQPGVKLNGAAKDRAPGITNVSFLGTDGEAVLQALDLSGFAASNGSACTSGSVAPSHVLTAMGASREESRGAVRFSLSHANHEDEIDRLLAVLPAVLSTNRTPAGR